MDEFNQVKELNRLILKADENLMAIVDFAHRLRTRFGYRILFPRHGRPTHIRGFHNGPYWSALQHDRSLGPRPELPRVIHEDFKALNAQGVRIRKEVLALWPHCNPQFIYPLNVVAYMNGAR